MAGTASVKIRCAITDLGNAPPITASFDISDVDEYPHQVRSLAATTAEAINLGSVAATSVQGIAIKLISGGSTAATGLSIDMEASTWATSHAILLQGEMIHWRPGAASVILSVKNLNSSACVYEYILYGEA